TGPAGATGANGTSILNGTGAPANTLGNDGDFYIATDTKRLYGPKASGAWPGTCVALVGPAGATGLTGATGGTGVAGATGATGVAGLTGATGPTGATGANGTFILNGTGAPANTLGIDGDF